MNCRKCLHFMVCTYNDKSGKEFDCSQAENCPSFRNRDNFIELPCRVGGRERLYYPVKGTNTILETKVFGIGVDEDGDVIFNPTEYPKKVIEMRGVEIGKTVFLDRAAAEAKLREMEGERE